MIGVIGDGQAGEIGDILAEGQRALDVVAGQRLVGVIFGDELRGQRIEALDGPAASTIRASAPCSS